MRSSERVIHIHFGKRGKFLAKLWVVLLLTLVEAQVLKQQNLAFAKALLCSPELMLLVEPTKGLDAQACARVVETLRQLAAEGVTIVLSTHDLDVAAACADEATLVFDGQAICTQEVPAFFEDNLIWRPHEKARLYGALANSHNNQKGTVPKWLEEVKQP